MTDPIIQKSKEVKADWERQAYDRGVVEEHQRIVSLIESYFTGWSNEDSEIIREALLTKIRGTECQLCLSCHSGKPCHDPSGIQEETPHDSFCSMTSRPNCPCKSQEKAECCPTCRSFTAREMHVVCVCHKPRTEASQGKGLNKVTSGKELGFGDPVYSPCYGGKCTSIVDVVEKKMKPKTNPLTGKTYGEEKKDVLNKPRDVSL